MIESVFVDTSAWIAFLDASDKHHPKIANFIKSSVGKRCLVTSDYVVYETLTYLNCSLKAYKLAKDFYAKVQSASGVEIVLVTKQMCDKALAEFFFKFTDKQLSVVDATSFLIMKKLNLKVALTLDRHYEQVGFAFASS